jgi:hypothetical protein
MAEWPTLGGLGEKIPADVIAVPAPRMTSSDLVHVPRNPARAPQGVEDAVYGMTVKPLSDIGMGIGSVVEGQGWNSPEASAGFLAAMGLLTPMKAGALAPRAGIKAYHGSPHDFDRFDISKIGTGEGAQAYGHGLYFAENPKTAEAYRDAFRKRDTPDAGLTMGYLTTGRAEATRRLLSASGDIDYAIESARKIANSDRRDSDIYARVLSELHQMKAEGKVPAPAKMYEVNINANPESFLDWEKPMRQQTETVQRAIPSILKEPVTTREVGFNPHIGEHLHDVMIGGGTIGAFPKSKLDEVMSNPARFDPRSGEMLYRSVARESVPPADLRPGFDAYSPFAASERLRDAGIPGIRYLDQGSRGQGTGTSNYVLFRDDIIDILRKYGIMAPVSGVALDQATQRQ